jgi:hypothetical protein
MPCLMAGNTQDPVKKVVIKLAVELLTYPFPDLGKQDQPR